jgi:hypothetical protein
MLKTYFYAALLMACVGYGNMIENAMLRVTVDPQRGRIEVLDKRSGQLWQQAESIVPPSSPPLLLSRLNGDPKELHSAGNCIHLTEAMAVSGAKIDSPADFSAILYLGRIADTLHFSVVVKDDVLMPPASGRRDWWEGDSVEFWLGSKQYAIRAEPGSMDIIHADGTGTGLSAQVERRADGYQVNAALPLSLAVKLPEKPGQRLPFALGINDCDGPAGRKSQLYYPRSWVHSQASSFLPLLLSPLPEKAVEDSGAERAVFMGFAALPEQNGWSWRFGDNDGHVRTVQCRLQGAELRFSESAIDGELPMERNIPSICGFIVDSPDGALVVADYSNGHLYPLNESPFRRSHMSSYGSIDMPWIGMVDMAKNSGYALILDSPDDAFISMLKITLDKDITHVPQLRWAARMGQFGAEARHYRFFFSDQGGYVAIAKHWRNIAKEMGYLVTLKEKAARNPDVHKLMGAADIWGSKGLSFAQQAKAHGIDKLLINSPGSAHDMAIVNELGYLTGRYDNYTDILPLRENEDIDSARGRIPEDCVLEQDQSRKKAWLTFDKKTQYMKRCPALWVPTAKIVIPKDLAKMPYNTRFIDVTTAEALYECYDPQHLLDRTAKRHCGEDLLAYVSKSLNLVTGGEHGRWWSVKSLHYLEGMMSGGYYSWPAGHLRRPQTKDHNLWEPEKPTDRFALYEKYGIGHETRLPLWELVFHDCISSTWYWGDATDFLLDAAPEITAKKDAFNILYGNMAMYWANQHGLWERDRSAFLRSYFHVSKMHETVGMAEMLSHEFLSEDRGLQRSVFADGSCAVVNFANDTRVVELAGQSYALPQNGFAVHGPRLRQSLVLRDGQRHSEIHCGDFHFYSAQAADGSGELSIIQAKSLGSNRLHVSVMGKAMELPVADIVKKSFFTKLFGGNALPDLTAYRLDERGQPEALAEFSRSKSHVALQGEGNFVLLWGKAAQQPDLVLRLDNAPSQYLVTESPRLSFEIGNIGRRAGKGSLRVYADSIAPERQIAQAAVPMVGVGASVTLAINLDISRLAGKHQLIAELTLADKYQDHMLANNRKSWPCKINLELKDFPLQKILTVHNGSIDRVLEPIAAQVDFAPLLDPAGLPIHPENIRVFQKMTDGSHSLVDYAQFTPNEGFDGISQAAGEIDFCYSAPAGSSVFVLAARQETWFPLPNQSTGFSITQAQKGEGFYQGASYSLAFRDGVIMDLMPQGPEGPGPDFLVSLLVSSESSGWAREEQAQLQHFELRKNGAALSELLVSKTLRNGVRYHKTYQFRPGRFTVIASVDRPAGGLYSRGFYCADADFLDDKGNSTRMGLGEGAQGIYGANKNPQWFALRGDGWAHSCVASGTVFDNLAFWDSKGDNNKGQIGFATGSAIDQLHYHYVVHGQQDDFDFASKDYQRIKFPAQLSKD